MVSQVSGSLSPQVLRLLGLGNDRNIGNNVAALTSGVRNDSSSVDLAGLTAAVSLQSEIVSLKGASQNITRQSSLLQVASDGAEQIGGILERLGELAALSNNGTLPESGREGLNEEFQQLVSEIDNIVGATEFDGKRLLDGSYADDVLDDDFSIADVRSQSLFSREFNVLNVEDAVEAYGAVKEAYSAVNEQRTEIASYQYRIDVTAASIDSALQNQEAAHSALQDTDVLSASGDGVLNLVKYQGGIATQAQGNNLQGNLLSLLSSR